MSCSYVSQSPRLLTSTNRMSWISPLLTFRNTKSGAPPRRVFQPCSSYFLTTSSSFLFTIYPHRSLASGATRVPLGTSAIIPFILASFAFEFHRSYLVYQYYLKPNQKRGYFRPINTNILRKASPPNLSTRAERNRSAAIHVTKLTCFKPCFLNNRNTNIALSCGALYS